MVSSKTGLPGTHLRVLLPTRKPQPRGQQRKVRDQARWFAVGGISARRAATVAGVARPVAAMDAVQDRHGRGQREAVIDARPSKEAGTRPAR